MRYNKAMTKVAIITRTKDRPVFLDRALKSIASQTYTDYIHVVVNDGGDKGVIDRLVEGLSSDQQEKTKVFHRDISSGAPDTIFNESIDRVKSEYFAIHDDDDTWNPEFLSQTVAHLNKNTHLGAVVVRADKVIETVEGGSLRIKKVSRWMPDVKVVSLYRQCIDNQFTPIATLFRRSAYEKIGKFDDTLPVVGDWEFGVRLLLEFDADFLDPGFPLAYYHHRDAKKADNSFADHNHRYYVNLVANRYLRKELSEGKMGVGYIMSKIKYDQSYIAKLIGRLLPTSIVQGIKNRVRK